jgi:UDP-glucose 4-epimerase
MKILVTGGAGYIGTHTIIELLDDGHDVIVVDNLSNSSRESLRRVEKITKVTIPFYDIDLRDGSALEKVFNENSFDAVIHFAGLKSVGQSVLHPIEYYSNNIESTLVLLQTMKKYNVKKIVFSSSATVYGDPSELPLKETSRVGVGITNPYGQTKFMIEQILRDLSFSDDTIEITLLRYFNPIGAHESGLIGEDPNGTPNNLLPYISQVAVGKLEKVSVFGNDYDTPDGTGVRDYIHVVDLAKGHVAAINHLTPGVETYNLGTGKGISVIELIHAFKKAASKDIPYQITSRRPGDIASCYANPTKANTKLNWKTEKSIHDSCKDSWLWQSQNPDGY